MLQWVKGLFDSPVLRRVRWHIQRVGDKVDRRFFTSLMFGLAGIVTIAAVIVWLIERDLTFSELGASLYWAGATVLGLGHGEFATGPVGWGVGWLLGLFGVAIVATITGALVGFVIDFLLKEGQGMGASGYRDHIVVCGWNATARDLIAELGSDEYGSKVVLIDEAERSPAPDWVYFVRGDQTNSADLARAGIEHAVSAIICPSDSSNESDMTSILTVLAIEALAPHVRTVVEVNNPEHVDHFKRASVDEIMVTSKLAAHLLARTAMYPGLSGLVVDIVSGGEGSELYGVSLPDDFVGLTSDEVAIRLRRDHRATLLAVTRSEITIPNPAEGFIFEVGDGMIVVAESIGALQPLQEASALSA
ncbi:MAG TPA: NAD-binding protein [Acidimicrobiia bacterium]|nr:NAD-binding protein [Acidimicrobiia bacterium]